MLMSHVAECFFADGNFSGTKVEGCW